MNQKRLSDFSSQLIKILLTLRNKRYSYVEAKLLKEIFPSIKLVWEQKMSGIHCFKSGK